MNIHKLFRWKHLGVLDQNLEDIDQKTMDLLIQGLRNELASYRNIIKNYDSVKYEKFGLPFIRSREEMIQKLVDINVTKYIQKESKSYEQK